VANAFTIDRALIDQRLLGAALGDIKSWLTWVAVLKAAFGQRLSEDEIHTFASVAGNRPPPTRRVRELWAIVGRRGGKSRIAAALAVYFATFVQHKLAKGEKGPVLVLAASLEQSRVVFGYTLAFLQESDVLRKEIAEATRTEIRLRNGITIAVHSNSFRTVRGRTLCACVFDEVAYWRDETSATPDAEVYSAVLPSLITTNGMLVGIGSPYRRIGLLHQKHRNFFGVDDGDTLVVKGSSKVFNQTLDDVSISAQRLADPTAAQSEWDAEFRDDLVGFLDDALIERAVDRDRPLELPPQPGVSYRAAIDPSGGAIAGDAYTPCIAHKEADHFVVDVVRGRQGPFDPNELTKEYAALCKQYRCGTVVGDKYGLEWVAAAWRDTNVTYANSDLPASALYLEMLPLFTRGLISLPDHPKLLRELRLLERIPSRMGKDAVSHPRGCHDDHANSVAGALRTLSNYLGYDFSYAGFQPNAVDTDVVDNKEAQDEAYRMALLGHIRDSVARGW
jgi:hypothetical protein